MDSGFILLALIIASLPFVLPIVSLVRQSRLRKRLAALENALGDQKHNIDDLERRLTQLKRDGVAAAPPLAEPPVPPSAAREPVAPAPPPPIARPAVTPVPVVPPAAAAPSLPRVPEKPLVPPPAPPRIEPRDVAPIPQAAMWRDLTSGPSAMLRAFDWEQLVGVKLFSGVAAIALVLAAIFFFKYSLDRGWLAPAVRVAIGLIVATALLVVCELRAAHRYRVTANALDAAAIAILFATFFSAHSLWNLIPSTLTFALLALVTVLAVLLSIRHDSIFIAVLGLVGGFATPALLSTGENRPIPLFTYLLLLNVGLAWVAVRKKWPILTILTLALTTAYQWGWVVTFLSSSDLTLGMGIFLVFSVTSFIALTLGRADRGGAMDLTLERSGLAASTMPLAFAIFLAAVPRYGAQTGLLFGFLLLVVAGLSAVAIARRDDRLHAIGATASVLVFAIWLATSYTTSGWRRGRGLHGRLCGVLCARAACRRPSAASVLLARRTRRICRARPAVRVPGDCAHRTGGGAAAGSVCSVVRRARGDRVARAEDERGGSVLCRRILCRRGRSVVVGDASDNRSSWLRDRPLRGIRAVLSGRAARPGAAHGSEMYPAWGGGALLIASLGLLLFLAAGPQAAESLWGLALLLAIVNAGLFIESAAGAMPLLSVAGAVLSWIVLAVWWDRAAAAVGVLPSLLVLVGLTLVMLGGHAWTHATSARAGSAVARQSFSFRHGVYLALAGQFFLFFVAQNPQWAAPPWPLFGALAVMTLATTAASLKIGMPELHAGGVVAAALVAFSFSRASPGAWALTSLAATEAVVAYGVGTLILSARARQLAAICRVGRSGRGPVRGRGQHHQCGARGRIRAARAFDRGPRDQPVAHSGNRLAAPVAVRGASRRPAGVARGGYLATGSSGSRRVAWSDGAGGGAVCRVRRVSPRPQPPCARQPRSLFHGGAGKRLLLFRRAKRAPWGRSAGVHRDHSSGGRRGDGAGSATAPARPAGRGARSRTPRGGRGGVALVRHRGHSTAARQPVDHDRLGARRRGALLAVPPRAAQGPAVFRKRPARCGVRAACAEPGDLPLRAARQHAHHQLVSLHLPDVRRGHVAWPHGGCRRPTIGSLHASRARRLCCRPARSSCCSSC